MKMALSEFALREKGIYGVLHIVILLLSLFLVVSISVDTFKGIPFYTQTVFMKVQFAVCILFLLDFILEWFLAKQRTLFCHSLCFSSGSHPLPEHYFLGRMDVFRGNHLFIAFYSFSARWLCVGHCGRLVDV